MRHWGWTVVAAVAALGLQACDQSPPVTTVQPPQASLPDDAQLRPPAGTDPAQVAVTPPADSSATPPVAVAPPAGVTPSGDATQPAGPTPPVATSPPETGTSQVAGAPPAAPEVPPASTSAMGAGAEPGVQSPAGAAPAQPAALGQGTAAPTEMWQAFPPGGAASSPSATRGSAAAPGKVSAADAPAKVAAADLPAVRNPGDVQGARLLAQRSLEVPVVGIQPTALGDNYEQSRGSRRHEAIDILAPTGTPVVAVDDGRIAKLFTSKPGGLTIYQFDRQTQLAYYYAHLQRYAPAVREGMDVKRGEVIGYVGSTGNADVNSPHLHFAVFRLGSPPKWWQGEAVNPYPALSRAAPAQQFAGR